MLCSKPVKCNGPMTATILPRLEPLKGLGSVLCCQDTSEFSEPFMVFVSCAHHHQAAMPFKTAYGTYGLRIHVVLVARLIPYY